MRVRHGENTPSRKRIPDAMRIGIPAETKQGERRVALLPDAVALLVRDGHEVRVEAGAGRGIGEDDAAYRSAGASIASTSDAWDVDLVVKVKEVQAADLPHLRRGQAIFSYHHLPGEPQRTRSLAAREITAIAFEMVRDGAGEFPLLACMSVIAGRMAIDIGAQLLGARLSRALVLGAGHAGLSAARAAAARGVHVTLLTRSQRSRDVARNAGFECDLSSPDEVRRQALAADLIVGAVFAPGEPTPKLLARSLVRAMKLGAVIVDISIDAGGVAETSRATTHESPTYVEEGVVHYCVANMPAAIPREGAQSLSAAVAGYVRELAGKSIERAVRENAALCAGVLLWQGRVSHAGIAAEAGLPYTALTEARIP
jgi:alanine dehydrogenase